MQPGYISYLITIQFSSTGFLDFTKVLILLWRREINPPFQVKLKQLTPERKRFSEADPTAVNMKWVLENLQTRCSSTRLITFFLSAPKANSVWTVTWRRPDLMNDCKKVWYYENGHISCQTGDVTFRGEKKKLVHLTHTKQRFALTSK